MITLTTLGRFGNQLSQYAFARSYCDKYGFQLQTCDWIGRKIFDLNEPSITTDLPRKSEQDIIMGEDNVQIYGYYQNQTAIIYSRTKAKQMFKIKDKWLQILEEIVPITEVAAHRRVGDYEGYGYTVVSEESYLKAAEEYNLGNITFITEENPITHPVFEEAGIGFLPDFYRIMKAKTILRGNSTFSWWAAILSNTDEIYSPVIEGKKTGDLIPFVKGNHPRFAELAFITDLHMEP